VIGIVRRRKSGKRNVQSSKKQYIRTTTQNILRTKNKQNLLYITNS